MKVVAEDILNALRTKHSKDVMVPECKTGPSWGNNDLGIMDLWVLRRSWTQYGSVGYEIKVSRSDFTGDHKWEKYLDFCNEFYFACPWRMIEPDELPEGIGLCWLTKTGGRLYTKRKAIHRTGVDHELVMAYLLICRTRITTGRELYRGPELNTEHNREYWQHWLQQREIDEELGRHVSRALRQEFRRLRGELWQCRTRLRQYERNGQPFLRMK